MFASRPTDAYFFLLTVPGLSEPIVIVLQEVPRGPVGTPPGLGLPLGERAPRGTSPLEAIATTLGLSTEESVSLTEGLCTQFRLEATRPVNLLLVEAELDAERAAAILIADLEEFPFHSFYPRDGEPPFRIHAVPLSKVTRLGDPLLLSASALYRAHKDATG